MVKVSIIIPVYNGEKFIETCLDSVLLQDVKEKEIICVDDGSTDNTAAIIKEYQKIHSEIKLIQQANMGSAKARNAALQEAKGDYIAFMDADDTYIDTSGLRKMVDASENYNLPICGSFLSVIRDGKISKAAMYRADFENGSEEPKLYNYKDIQYDYNYQCYIFKREFLKLHGIDFPDLRRYQDPPFMVHAMCTASQFIVLPVELYCYRSRTEVFKFNFIQLNHTLMGMKMNIEFACKNNLEILFVNNVIRLNKDFFYRIKESLADGNTDAINILMDIRKIVENNPFGINADIRIFEKLEEALRYLNICDGSYQFPYKKIPYGSNIAIYGAGVVGKYIRDITKQTKYCNIVKWVDRNYEELRKLGFDVEAPDELKNSHADYIIIAVESETVFEEIRDKILMDIEAISGRIIGPIEKILED